jgi:hypothetical protein
MLTWVIGLPAAGYIGFALMSIVDFEAASDVLSALGVPMLATLDLVAPSFLTGADFADGSSDVVLCGMFLMSLYFDCLSQGSCQQIGSIA